MRASALVLVLVALLGVLGVQFFFSVLLVNNFTITHDKLNLQAHPLSHFDSSAIPDHGNQDMEIDNHGSMLLNHELDSYRKEEVNEEINVEEFDEPQPGARELGFKEKEKHATGEGRWEFGNLK